MNTKKRTILLLLIGFTTVSLLQAQKKYADAITVKSSKQHLDILAGKKFEGRGTGQKGGRLAEAYIAKHFKAYGLIPIGNGASYFQPVALRRSAYQVKQMKFGNTRLSHLHDFYVLGRNKMNVYQGDEIVFVGYGLQDVNYNEIKQMDLKGRIVMLYDEGEPVDQKGNSLLTGTPEKSEWTKNRFKRVQEINKLKPKLVIACNPSTNPKSIRNMNALFGGSVALDKGEQVTPASSSDTDFVPVIHVTEQVADELLAQRNTSLAKFKALAALGVQESIVLKTKIRTEMGHVNERFSDANVIGLIPGTDLKEEYVVVCGHYDHEGILGDGTFFPGADDNGSGSTAVLELARTFAQAKKEGKGPRRSILFMAFAAEERGLLGSKYYVENPLVPLEKTVACINIDMIGRIDDKHLNGNPNYIHPVGWDKLGNDLRTITEEVNSKYTQLELDTLYNDPKEPMRVYERSDHYNFVLKNIPSLYFFSGTHPHYHTPEDTVDKIDFPTMVKREKLIFHTVWEIANRTDRPRKE